MTTKFKRMPAFLTYYYGGELKDIELYKAESSLLRCLALAPDTSEFYHGFFSNENGGYED